MTDRTTIESQIDQVRRFATNIHIDLAMIGKGIYQEPMGFAVDALHRLKVLAAAIENLTLTCDHTLDRQRNAAFDLSNATLDARKALKKKEK